MSVDSWRTTTAMFLPGARYPQENRWDELVMELLSNGARARFRGAPLPHMGAAWGQHVIFLVGLPSAGRHLTGVH
jgi:hypothetical protein